MKLQLDTRMPFNSMYLLTKPHSLFILEELDRPAILLEPLPRSNPRFAAA